MRTSLLLLSVVAISSHAVPAAKYWRILGKDLSDVDAFLGPEEKKAFDELSPEEIKKRLGNIFSNIDKDSDGYATEDEVKGWIQYVQKLDMINDVTRMWNDRHLDENDILCWSAYSKMVFGYDGEAVAERIRRDRRRWDAADTNKDDCLSKKEFTDFLYPELNEHMHGIVVMETIEDIDKDKDGHIDVEEYIADMWLNRKDGEEEPDWVKSERNQFRDYRDKNKDGKLDGNEVRDWMLQQGLDQESAKSHHFVFEADVDKDGKLSIQEILRTFAFAGGHATDFGDVFDWRDEF